MSRNEAQVRFELIDPALEERGWSRRTDIRVEETARTIDIVHGQPRRRSAGRTDYVLRRPPSGRRQNPQIRRAKRAKARHFSSRCGKLRLEAFRSQKIAKNRPKTTKIV